MTKASLDFSKELPRVEDAGMAIVCFQCSACVADCPAAAHSPRFNPRDIMLKVLLGLEDELIVEGSVLWDCTSCYICMERRPQGVQPIEAMEEFIAELGIESERLRLAWISASEGQKFADTIREMVEDVKKLGPFDKQRLAYKASEKV